MREAELKKQEIVQEGGLADMADMAERDHEVQMARAELYKIAKYAIKLHEMLKGVSEAQGMEGWQQSKITKAADYIGSVYHAMDYDMKFETTNEAKESPATCGCKSSCGHCGGDHTMAEVGKECGCCGNQIRERKDTELKAGITTSSEVNAAASAQQSDWKTNPSFTKESYKSTLANRLAENLAKKKTERSLTKGEEKKKEKIVKGMKKDGDFKDRYGKDAKAVMYATATKLAKKSKTKKESFNTLEESVGKPISEDEFDRLAEKKDACYHKVKSRYKVWPSAYASGALVQCRKKGAKNWGKSKK